MIKSFRDKKTRTFAEGGFVRQFEPFKRQAEKKLRFLEYAENLGDLAYPGNELEALSGDRKGQYSIRINKQWRVCFEWQGNEASNVEIVDYH